MNLMIDLETLDTKATSVIVSVGVCAFDVNGIHDKQYFVLECQEQLDKGRTVSFDTLEWWFRQSKDVTDAAFNQKVKISVNSFMDKLMLFCSKNNIKKVYAQGPDFDLSMLTHIHNQYDKELPWDFWLARDTRTVYDFMRGNKPERLGTHHNAMDDAVHQAECVIIALKEKQ